MCYYNGQKVTRSEYIRLKNLEKLVSRYDFLNADLQKGFDYGLNAVLKPMPEEEDFDIVKMEWGFLPSHLPDRTATSKFRIGYKNDQGKWIEGYDTLNARSENLFVNDKGRLSIFGDAAMKRRILVLSSGFYEWRHIYRKNKRTGNLLKTPDKYPYFIHLPDHEYFYMAGIWNPWLAKDGTGEYTETFSIVTTEANKLMAQVHTSRKRMPCILHEDLAYEWIFGKLNQNRITEIAKTQYPWQKMHAYTVAKDFRTSLNPSAPFEYDPALCPPIILEEAA